MRSIRSTAQNLRPYFPSYLKSSLPCEIFFLQNSSKVLQPTLFCPLTEICAWPSGIRHGWTSCTGLESLFVLLVRNNWLPLGNSSLLISKLPTHSAPVSTFSSTSCPIRLKPSIYYWIEGFPLGAVAQYISANLRRMPSSLRLVKLHRTLCYFKTEEHSSPPTEISRSITLRR